MISRGEDVRQRQEGRRLSGRRAHGAHAALERGIFSSTYATVGLKCASTYAHPPRDQKACRYARSSRTHSWYSGKWAGHAARRFPAGSLPCRHRVSMFMCGLLIYTCLYRKAKRAEGLPSARKRCSPLRTDGTLRPPHRAGISISKSGFKKSMAFSSPSPADISPSSCSILMAPS